MLDKSKIYQYDWEDNTVWDIPRRAGETNSIKSPPVLPIKYLLDVYSYNFDSRPITVKTYDTLSFLSIIGLGFI